MIRLIILLFTRRWGLIIIGALVLIGGLIYGATSHNVTYQSVSPSSVAHFLSGDSGTGYLQMTGSPKLYILNEGDFTPAISGTNTFGDGDNISFIYRTDSTTDIDQTSTIGTHLIGPAYTVVELTVSSSNGPQMFKTSDYSKNPNGFYQNNWLAGGAIAFVGLIILALAFVLPPLFKKKQQPAYNATTMGIGRQGQPNPYQQPNQPPFQQPFQPPYQPPNQPPFQQPYQDPASYGQYPPQQPGQYPPPPPYNQPYDQAQPGQYDPTQVANPYDQPPQQ